MDLLNLMAKISLDSSEYINGLKKIGGLGVKAIGAATAAVGAFAGASVKTGMQFDSAMSQVAATMGKTVGEIQDLRDFALDMGSTTVFSATQAAEALNYMALAGYDSAMSMEMLPNVLNLAAAGSIDLALASDMVTDAQTAFGISSERTTQMVDEMAKAASTGNTSVQQLGEAFLVVGGLAKELNGGFVTLDDGTQVAVDGLQEMEIALTAMANAGIKGSEAGTHMRNMIMKLSSPTAEGAKRLEAMGVSVFDAEQKMRSLSDIFGDLNTKLSTMSQQEKIQTISELFNARDLASAEALLAAIGEDWDDIGESILNADGAAEQMAETQLDNLAGDITLFKSALEGAQIAISDKLTPSLREFVQFGSDGLSQLTKAFQEGGLSGAMDVFGEVLADGLAMIVEGLPQFVEAGTQLLMSLVNGIIENLPVLMESGIQIITYLITSLSENLPALIPAMAQAVSTMAQGISEALPTLIPAAVDIILGLVNALLSNVNLLVDAALQLIVGLATGLINAIPELIAAVPQIIGELVTALIAAIPQLLSAAGEIMASIGKALYDAAPESLQDVIDAIGNAFEQAWEAIQAVWNLVAPFFEAIWEAIKAIWSVVAPFFEAIFQSAWEGIKGVWDVVTSYFKTVWDVIAGIFSVVASVLTGDFRGAWEGIKGIWSSVGSFFSGVWNTIKGVFSAVGSFFSNAFRTAVNNIKSAFGNIVSFFQGKWNSIKNVFSNARSWFQTVGSNIVSGIRTGISNGWAALTSWVAEKARSLLNAAKSALGIASPSKVFRDEVGKMITLGIADGIVSKDAMRALDTATAELTGDSVKDLEKMVKAWDDVYKNYYEGLEHQNFFLELAGDTDAIIANYRKMQETLHEQKEHYLKMGVDANDSAIRDMEEQWWEYQDKIDGVYDGIAKKAEQTYDTMIDVMEHKLFLSEKQGKSPEERLAILEQLMEETHKRAEVLRSQGYTDDSKEIRELQKQWWGYHDDVEDINEDIAKSVKERNDKIADAMKKSVSETADIFTELAEAAQKAYDEAFDAIMDKQKAMQDKLAGYGELYKSTTTTSGRTYVSLQDLDRQTKQLERYGEIIEELRSRGVSGSLMEDILGMGIDEGSEFGKRLLNMSEGGLNDYLASYQRKQDIAADIASRYYKPEFDTLNGQNVELNVAEQRNLEYTEEQTSLLRRIAETFEGSGGQTVQVVVDGQVIANATFDDIVAVSKMRGLDIVNVKEG